MTVPRFQILCIRCHLEIHGGDVRRCVCPSCGGPAGFAYSDPGSSFPTAEPSMWRYGALLPVEHPDRPVTLGEGVTPLLPAGNAGGIDLYIKDETRNPTGSQKDRALSVAITRAMETGIDRVIMATTGSAGIAGAAYAARARLACTILMPAGVPPERRLVMSMFGAQVLGVRGSIEEIIGLVASARDNHGWCDVTTYRAANPYQAEGPKTIAYEIVDQMGSVPDAVLVPVGGGGTLAGIGAGFQDLRRLGRIPRLPRLVGCQQAHYNVLQLGLERDLHTEKELMALGIDGEVDTIARNLRHTDLPDGQEALAAIRESGGMVVTATDDELLASQADLARLHGIFAEPSSAVTWHAAGVLAERGKLSPGQRVVLVVTGSGLREVQLALETHGVKSLDDTPDRIAARLGLTGVSSG